LPGPEADVPGRCRRWAFCRAGRGWSSRRIAAGPGRGQTEWVLRSGPLGAARKDLVSRGGEGMDRPQGGDLKFEISKKRRTNPPQGPPTADLRDFPPKAGKLQVQSARGGLRKAQPSGLLIESLRDGVFINGQDARSTLHPCGPTATSCPSSIYNRHGGTECRT
jgi:hypothetical protein